MNKSNVPPTYKTCFIRLLQAGLVASPVMALAVEETVLSAVSVSAKAEAQEIRRNASAGKLVFDRQELDTLDAASIAELLRKLPGTGMFADPDSGGGPRGRGRGPDRNMPQILVDGQPLPGGDRKPASALRLPVELIERVEIIRNSTAEFPVLNPAGVINLVLRDVPPTATRGVKVGLGSADGRPSLRLEGQYGEPDGDFGYLLAGSLTSRADAGERDKRASTYTASVPTGQENEVSRFTGRDTNLTLSPRFSWKLPDNQRLTVSPFFAHTENDRDTTVERRSNGVAGSDREHDDSTRSMGRLLTEWRLSGAQGAETTAKLIVQGERESADKFSRKYDAAGALTSAITDRSERRENEWVGDLRSKRLLGDSHVVTVAGELRGKASEDTQTRSGSQTSRTVAELDEFRRVVWAQDEWQLSDRHVLTPGLRWTLLETQIDDSQSGRIDRTVRALDPSLHYLWQLTDQWNLRSSIARNSRVPFSRELLPVTRLASGVNSSSNPDRGGNPQLEPERLRSIELGVEYFLEQRAGTIGFSTFHRQIKDHTQRLTQLEAGRWVERPYNVGEAELRGFLFDFKSKLIAWQLPQLTVRGNAGYTHTRMLERVAGLGAGEGPRKSLNLGLDYELPAYRLTTGGNFNYVSAIDRESSASVRQEQGARRQLDLYALVKLDRQVALRVSAQNVSREERRNYLEEVDANSLLQRTENDFAPGVASYMLTLEAKW